MSASKRGLARPVGRPPIDDALWIYLSVEVGRRRSGMNLHAYTSDRKTRYTDNVSSLGINRTRELKGESLRRRYNKSRSDIGLVEIAYAGLHVKQPDVALARKVVERMIRDIMEN